MYSTPLAAGFLLCLTPLLVAAQTAPVIIVTPTRTVQQENLSSSTVYVLDNQAIRHSGARTTSELLRGIPGVQLDDLFGNGAEVSVSLRGFSATANANTLVLVNGRRLNHADTSAPDLHHIFPRDIERIEVLVGSAGTLYGDQAVGGVVNIITRRANENSLSAGVELGSFDRRGVQFQLQQPLNQQLALRLSAERFDSDHYRDHNEESNRNLQGHLAYRNGPHSAFVELHAIDDEMQLPGALLENEFNADPRQINTGFSDDFLHEKTDVFSTGYEYEYDASRFSIDLTRRKTDADIRQSFRDLPSPASGFSARENRSLNPKLSGTALLGGISMPYVTGIDLEESEYQLNLPNAFGVATASNEQRIASLFVQLRPQLSTRTGLTLGLRVADMKKDMQDGFSFPSGLTVKDDVEVFELGLVHRPAKNLKWTLRYDENFRFAKINELALAEPGQVLNTQTGESYETGLQWTLSDVRLNASLYRLELENEIVFDPSAGPDFGSGPTGANVNLQKTRRDGIALSAHVPANAGISWNFELGLVDARFRSGVFSGKHISGVAKQIAKIRMDFAFDHRYSSYLEGHYKGDLYAQGDNANAFGKLDSVNVLNAGFRYDYRNLQLALRINNLADRKYAEFVTNNGFGAAYQPSPQRNYLLTASYRFY